MINVLKSKKKLLIGILLILLVVSGKKIAKMLGLFGQAEATMLKKSSEINVVPTMDDKITQDSVWCCTFQLVWNDLKKEIVMNDIVLQPQEKIANNLNKESFDETMISEDYYYKIYGLKTLELKEEIENSVMEKFGEKCELLDDIDWSEDELHGSKEGVDRFLLFSMLYRKFEFLNKYSKLDKGTFADQYRDVEYFGIDESSSSARDQMEVLYYYSKDDFAVLINTKQDDELILCKSPKGDSFSKIYSNMKKKETKYSGSKIVAYKDYFKAPNLNFDEKVEYSELENKEFRSKNPSYIGGEINKALQSIKLTVDESGGEIKSTATIDVAMDTCGVERKPRIKPKYFNLDNTFAVFLREKGKEKPYFAARIDDITKFQ